MPFPSLFSLFSSFLLESDDDSSDESLSQISKKERKNTFRLQVLKMISYEKWGDLLLLDELRRELEAKNLLPGFEAPRPSFPPTFKRTRHTKIERSAGETHRFYWLSSSLAPSCLSLPSFLPSSA